MRMLSSASACDSICASVLPMKEEESGGLGEY